MSDHNDIFNSNDQPPWLTADQESESQLRQFDCRHSGNAPILATSSLSGLQGLGGFPSGPFGFASTIGSGE